MIRDRRREKRIKKKLLVYIDELEAYANTLDLSTGGCLVDLEDHQLSKGQVVHLKISLPGNKEVEVVGKVVHTDKGKAGIKFIELGLFRRIYLSYLKALNVVNETRSFFEEIQEARSHQKGSFKEAGRKVVAAFDTVKNIFWVILIGSLIWSFAQNKIINQKRADLIHQIELKRHSKVITLIHRQETVGFFGVPIKQYIQMEDAEAVLRTIREIPDDQPIDIIVHTPGGMLLPAYQIAKALKDHKGKVTAFIPHHAMSGGTLIALAADEIVMDRNAVLGPVDPQLNNGKITVPAVAVLKTPELKSWDQISDNTLIMIDQAEKAINQVKQYVKYLLQGDPEKKVNGIIARLVTGQVTHDYPVFFNEARKLGLPVSDKMPKLVYKLMNLYPQPSKRKY